MPAKHPPVFKFGSQRLPDPIYAAVNNLIKVCGFGPGESGTEEFYYALRDVIYDLEGTIEESHKEGLCYDMCAAIAGELAKRIQQSN